MNKVKSIILLIGMFISFPTIATEMCARNNMIVIPLDSNVGGSGNSYNQKEMVWSATFPYGMISGEATCLSAAEGGKPSGTMGVYINSTVPVGTLATYGFTALILEVTNNWKMVFFGSFVVVMITAVGWWLATGAILPKLTRVDIEDAAPAANGKEKEVQKAPLGELVLSSGMIFMCLVLMIQGMLKEGITAWMPNLMGEKFEIGTSLAIVSTALIPMFNIIGISIAATARIVIGDEIRCSFLLFLAGTASLVILYITSFIGLIPMFIFFSIATTIMMAVNTCYVGVVPGYFAKKGLSSSVSGILNAFVNLGIATSMFATGAFSEAFGWDMTMIFWICCGGVGIFSSFIGYQIWKKYKLKLEA